MYIDDSKLDQMYESSDMVKAFNLTEDEFKILYRQAEGCSKYDLALELKRQKTYIYECQKGVLKKIGAKNLLNAIYIFGVQMSKTNSQEKK